MVAAGLRLLNREWYKIRSITKANKKTARYFCSGTIIFNQVQ